MTAVAKVLRYAAFTLMALFGLLGGMFVAGEAFAEPGGWVAAGMTALWLVPLVALSVFAVMRPGPASRMFVWVTAAAVAFTLADAAFGIVPRDAWGPVAAVVVFALGVALAFLGLHRAGLAGLLMIAAALGQLAATIIGFAAHGAWGEDVAGEGPGPGAMLTGSSGVVVVPLLVVGAMFLLSGVLDHEPLRPGHAPRVRPAH